MSVSQNVKRILIIVMAIALPTVYAYFMVYWFSYVSAPIVQFFKADTVNTASVLLFSTNAVGILIFSIILSWPIKYLFDQRRVLAAVVLAFLTVAWSSFGWFSNIATFPGFITIAEWVAVLVIIPLVVAFERWITNEAVVNGA